MGWRRNRRTFVGKGLNNRIGRWFRFACVRRTVLSVSFTGLTVNATYGLTPQIGTHASIGAVMSDGSTITALRWGSTLDGTEFGTGSAPTDFTASDGALLYLRATAGGVDYYASKTIRYAAAVNTVAPTISAPSTGIGDDITFSGGTFTGASGGAFSRKWLRDGVEIIGEVGLTYTVLASDDGAEISAQQLYTNSGGVAIGTTNAIVVDIGSVVFANGDTFDEGDSTTSYAHTIDEGGSTTTYTDTFDEGLAA